MRVGCIFECGRGGADSMVCQYFLQKMDPSIEIHPRFMDNKKNLIEDCGPVTSLLLAKCDQVAIIWDLFPAWREKGIQPCRKIDREKIFASLKAERVPPDKVVLICIEEELEAWVLADDRALKKILSTYKHPHPLGKLPIYKKPDKIKNPKKRLTNIFNQELGNHRRYEDYRDALKIVEAQPDFRKIKRSTSFCRFAEKIAGIKF